MKRPTDLFTVNQRASSGSFQCLPFAQGQKKYSAQLLEEEFL